ncbi:MAG: IS1595 family transposase [Candidatus Thiodiazotropha sp. (ex Lucinoma aequizonata)]|nr:IS1595 family transposase [Candidatus Thiodiazotropha sp. (ex Lucinoma aequizonata)]
MRVTVQTLTSGTIFDDTKLPLTTWFLSMFLVTQTKNGISALELMRHLGVSYGTAWSIKHKLMQVMKEREDGQLLDGIIQMDDAYWGG